MRRIALLITVFLTAALTAAAQDLLWKAEVSPFFDNTEFGGSAIEIPQTMAGVHVVPEIGLRIDSVHRIFTGVDVMREFGATRFTDQKDWLAYYRFDGKPFFFAMGIFPRNLVMDEDYPRMLIADSIFNYRPVMTGLCWAFTRNQSYMRVWMDWTGRKAPTVRESFFMGESFRLQRNAFYLQHHGYMFHLAGNADPDNHEALHDNGMLLTSLGADLSAMSGWDKLDFSLGYALGIEDERGVHTWQKHNALYVQAKVEHLGVGVHNAFYKGDRQMRFYNEHGNVLYWGNRMFRASAYNRTDFIVHFLNTGSVKTDFRYTLHSAENKVYHEQSLYVTVRLGNENKPAAKKIKTLWSPWLESLRNR